MKSFLRNIHLFTVIFILLSIIILAALLAQQWRSQEHLRATIGAHKQSLFAQYSLAGGIYSRDMEVLATSEQGLRQYASDPILQAATMQLVGDYTQIIGNTIESNYQLELLGQRRNLFRQILLDFTGKGIRGDDLILTVDSRLNSIAYQGLMNVRGAAVLLNYKTGEVLVMTSTPSTTQAKVIEFTDIPDTALVNRAINGLYSPGSTFKIITAAAYIDDANFNPDMIVQCDGSQQIPNGVSEVLGNGHGPMDLYSGFANSCNLYFGNVSQIVGLEKLVNQAENFGWNQELSLDKLSVATSTINCPAGDAGLLSWLAIGQPVGPISEKITPLQLAIQAGTIANEGHKVQPHILKNKRDPLGKVINMLKDEQGPKVLTDNQTATLQALMLNAVQTGLVQNIAIAGFEVGAKSGTAEVAGMNANGLIAAYVKNEKYPLAVAVIGENVGSGAGLPLQVAKSLLINAINLYPEGLN